MADDTPTITPPPFRPTPPNTGWIWYFVILATLTILATGILIAFNRYQQLKPEDVEAALKQWKANGPHDYTLSYTVQTNSASGTSEDRYQVKVRDRIPVEVTYNGAHLPPEQRYYHDMSRLLNYIERFLELDAKPGAPKVYQRAIFNTDNGALKWFVRRITGSVERVEITVQSFEAGK